MSSPYTPPAAPVRDPAAKKGSAAWAVIAGLLVDLGGSFLAGIVLTVLYGATLLDGATDEAQIAAELSSIPADSWVSIIGMIVGCLFSILGGYVCARIARRSEYKLGGIVAAIAAVVGALVGAGYYPLMLNISMIVATVLSVLSGVWLGVRRNER
ncbi:MAG TPA: hypothetical protein VED01_06350 [Burkholderiales bacterium]|nr:hypothetical protein [Burkholderiales bacterium]